jgi:hypothetical protein
MDVTQSNTSEATDMAISRQANATPEAIAPTLNILC